MSKRPTSIILIIGIVAAVSLFAALNQFANNSAPSGHQHDLECADGCELENSTAAQVQKTGTKNASEDNNMPQAPLTAEPGDKIAVIQTNKGTIKVKLYTKDMPISTKNFIDLIERKFYDGLTFHRVEDWVVQGGDPTATGTGGSGKTIKLEINKKNGFKKPGMIGMARTNVPDSATSQFFFNTKPAEFLDSGYACFGGVVDGMEVLYKLKVGDKMTKVTLEDYKPAAKANGVDAPPPPPPAPSVN